MESALHPFASLFFHLTVYLGHLFKSACMDLFHFIIFFTGYILFHLMDEP